MNTQVIQSKICKSKLYFTKRFLWKQFCDNKLRMSRKIRTKIGNKYFYYGMLTVETNLYFYIKEYDQSILKYCRIS